MPVARVQLPDGRIGRFEVPEGTTPEQVNSYIAQQIPTQPAQAVEQKPLLNAGQKFIRPLARAARSGLSGIASIGDIAGVAVEPIRQGMRGGLEALGVDFMGQNTPYVPPSQGVKNLFDELTGGIAKPRTSAEKVVDVASEAVSGAGIVKGAQAMSGLASQGAEQILKKLAPQTGRELASIAGAGAGSEIATQLAPDNPIAPLVGGLAGGVATVKGIDAVRKSGNIKLLEKAYFNRQAQRTPEANRGFFDKQATKILAKNLQASPEKLQSLKSQLQQDKNFVLPDIGGDEVRALTRQVGKFKGGARNDIEKFFVDRDRNASTRIVNAINSKVSGTQKYFNSLDELTSIRSELARDLYTDAYQTHKNIKITPSLDKFIQDGRFQNALAKARKDGVININEPVNSLHTLDMVYRTLRDNASEAIRSGRGNIGDSLNQMSRDLVKRIDEVAPKYKKARNTFAGYSDLIDAQEMGLKYNRQRPEEIAKLLKGMTQSEKDAYKIGVRESLERDVFGSAFNADEAKKIFGKTVNRQQLKVILGDEFEEFSQAMRKEIRRKETQFKVLGGSRTDFNTIEDGQAIESLTNVAKGGKGALVNEAVNVLADTIKNKYMGINTENSKALAKALTSNKGGIEAINKLIATTPKQTQKLLINQVKQDYGYLALPLLQGN